MEAELKKTIFTLFLFWIGSGCSPQTHHIIKLVNINVDRNIHLEHFRHEVWESGMSIQLEDETRDISSQMLGDVWLPENKIKFEGPYQDKSVSLCLRPKDYMFGERLHSVEFFFHNMKKSMFIDIYDSKDESKLGLLCDDDNGKNSIFVGNVNLPASKDETVTVTISYFQPFTKNDIQDEWLNLFYEYRGFKYSMPAE